MRQSTLGKSQYHAGVAQVREAHHQRLGRPHQLHLQPLEGQPVRRRRTSSRHTAAEAQDAYNLDAEYSIGLLDVPHKITIVADLRAAVRRRQALGEERRRRLPSSATGPSRRSSRIESGFPMPIYEFRTTSRHLHPHAARQSRHRRSRNRRHPLRAHRPGGRSAAARSSPAAPASLAEPRGVRHRRRRSRSARCRARSATCAPRTATTGTSSPLKDIRFKGSMRGEIKFEVLNMTNTVKVRGPETRIGNALVRPHQHAVRASAPDAADVPAEVLRKAAPSAGGASRLRRSIC